MSKKNRDQESLIDIYRAGKNALDFTEKISLDEFNLNIEKQSATLYQIQIIGEATKRISLEFKEANPHVPWRKIARMRDKIAHDYDGINLKTVWSVIKDDIPELLRQIKKLIPERP